jgi:predicted TIM-barrel fold metal-dependent hydrolase
MDHHNGVDIKKDEYYADPEKWKYVPEKHGKPRINVAHFGGCKEIGCGNTKWMQTIIELIKKYPNVFTDLSCFVKKDTLLKNQAHD